jgi:hypothetical protein
LSVSDGQHADRAVGMLVSGNYFDVVGTRPLLGRTFVKSEDETRVYSGPPSKLSRSHRRAEVRIAELQLPSWELRDHFSV